jgi:hypothetical protein
MNEKIKEKKDLRPLYKIPISEMSKSIINVDIANRLIYP